MGSRFFCPPWKSSGKKPVRQFVSLTQVAVFLPVVGHMGLDGPGSPLLSLEPIILADVYKKVLSSVEIGGSFVHLPVRRATSLLAALRLI